MAAMTTGRALGVLNVRDAMTCQVKACRPDETITAVRKRLARFQIRRMPVVDDHGWLMGIVSLRDLAQAAAGRPDPAPTLTAIGETLTEITRRADESRTVKLPHEG